ncbi:MAG: M48 family metallopeptidase [Candidatus Levyibacteriota bacterium]
MENIIIVRSIKRKSVGIQILANGTIKVTIPYFFLKGQVPRILKEKEDWIRSTQQKLLLRKQQIVDKNEYLYLGKSYQVAFRSGQKELIEIGDKLYFGNPNKANIKTYLTSWYKQQARKIIVERVYHYAKIAGLSFTSINLTSAETRWGSCSNNKTLNFNWKLIMAPMPVIDYVVAHELAHLTQMNHSRDFWETVRKMYPLYREYRTWLKRNGHALVV